jgi:hypothetical protein
VFQSKTATIIETQQTTNGISRMSVIYVNYCGCRTSINRDFKHFLLLLTLERLVDRYLKTGPLVRHPLAATQYAYREGRSTETALHHLVGRVERQLEMKEYAIGAFLDIEGAFHSTSIDTIKQAMNRHDVPEALVDWTENMLAERRTMFYHGERVVEGTPDRG